MNYYFGVWKKYAVFHGRARRAEYWMFVLFSIIASIILSIIGEIIHTTLLGNLYTLAVIIPSLAVGARRLHDIGKSGWWLLIGLIPIIGWIILIMFAVMDGQPGDNQYGSNPKGTSTVMPVQPTV